jgi:hypothetical protein
MNSIVLGQQWDGPTNTTGDIYRSGNVGIGTTNPVDKLYVHGNIRIQGDLGWINDGDLDGTAYRAMLSLPGPGQLHLYRKDDFLTPDAVLLRIIPRIQGFLQGQRLQIGQHGGALELFTTDYSITPKNFVFLTKFYQDFHLSRSWEKATGIQRKRFDLLKSVSSVFYFMRF